MPVVDFPLQNLILAETNQSRTSPLREAGGTLVAIFKQDELDKIDTTIIVCQIKYILKK